MEKVDEKIGFSATKVVVYSVRRGGFNLADIAGAARFLLQRAQGICIYSIQRSFYG